MYSSFTSTRYDPCELDKKLQESQAPGRWLIDPTVAESQESCFQQTSPFMHNPFKNAVPKERIDQENDLRNQTRVLSKCPQEYYPKNSTNNVNFSFENCKSDFLTPEYTRVNKSCNIFSGININRFNPLCDDIQDANKIQNNSYIGINSRLTVKDAHTEIEDKKRNAQLSIERLKNTTPNPLERSKNVTNYFNF